MRFNSSGKPVPYLAKSMKASDGDRVWTMTLRPGVKFQDGTDLDADAVVFNIKRNRTQAASPAHPYAELVKSATAVNDLTVRFELKRPLNSFDGLFCQPVWAGTLGAVVSPAAVKKYGANYGKHPVGAGPFKLQSWRPGNEAVLVRNPNYWQKGKPYLDKVVFKVLPDQQTRDQSVASGTVDMISAVTFNELNGALKNPKLKTYYGSANGSQYLIFNFDKPPFNDRRMRQAAIQAINLDALSQALFEGHMAKAYTFLGENSEFYSKQAAQVYPKYDPESARKLIASYKKSGGNPNFTYTTSNTDTTLAQFLQAQWKAVGLNVQVKTYDISTYIERVVQNHSGQFQTAGSILGPFVGIYPWIELFATDGTGTYGGYSNPKVDKLLSQAAAASTPAKEVALYQQAQVLASQDVAYGWLSRSYLSRIAQKYVHGVVQDPSKTALWATMWVDK
jgi:peptide/nickel transport system substrate-binding protein